MIKTINIKDLIRYLVELMALVMIAIYSTRFFSNKEKRKSNSFFKINFVSMIEENISLANLKKKENLNNENKSLTSRNYIKRILETELPHIEEKDEVKAVASSQEKKKEKDLEKERTTSQIKETYTNTYRSVKIKNLTKIKLTEEILKPDYMVSNKKNILIYHTHTCESYTSTKDNSYKATGNFRTTNLNYSVVKVGRVLKKELEKFKFKVIQNETKHDYPAYTGSYTRSLATVEEMLKNNKADIVFDIHRDAVGKQSDYAPTANINGETVAQLMFVIGTNDGGGKHPGWKKNLKFAVKIQEKANQMYPGLFRSINLRSATFNQKVANAASIIEVGATGNTLEEATASMKYLAKVLDAVLNEK